MLLVHGSRDPAWMEPFEELKEKVQNASPGAHVRVACLQFCEPGLKQVISELAGKGVDSILVVPVFISGKGHVLKDVPQAVESASEDFPALDIRVTDALGEFPDVASAFQDALISLLPD